VQWAKSMIRGIAAGAEWVLRSYGLIRPTSALVEGRLVGWGDLGRAFWIVGIGWSVLVLALSLLAFRRKELAVYSGQG